MGLKHIWAVSQYQVYITYFTNRLAGQIKCDKSTFYGINVRLNCFMKRNKLQGRNRRMESRLKPENMH